LERQTHIFNARANLIVDKNLPAEKRIQLLNQMEESVYEQETTLQRIKRILTNPKFLVGVAALGLAAYGIYRAEALGNAAEQAGNAAKKTNESLEDLVNTVVCGYATFGQLTGPAAWGAAAYCAFQAYRNLKGNK